MPSPRVSLLRPLRLALAFATCALVPSTRAVTTEHDLQKGLAYLRTNDVAADLDAVAKFFAAHPALVLDLRHTTADAGSAGALGRLLAQPPAATHVVRLLLVSDATAPALLTQLRAGLPGVIVLAAQSPGLKPDIVVATTPEEDRVAFQALTDGLDFDKLLSGTTPQKIRYDEASLVRDHANGILRSLPYDDADDTAEPETPPPATTEKLPAQPVDRVLLRAVQLHRTLLALKKL
jgi:hypothetical protein